jgi:hypothetical protein
MRLTLLLAFSVALALASACGDPTHDDAVAALGPEAPGVSPGPTHRPGQPCLTCHGGLGPAGQQFSIGGTAYENQRLPAPDGAAAPASPPLVGATVQLSDSSGLTDASDGASPASATRTTTTNSVGNFFILESDWAPTFPVGGLGTNHQVQICAGACASSSVAKAFMVSAIGRDGSCADCHFYPPGPLSPGPLYLMAAP